MCATDLITEATDSIHISIVLNFIPRTAARQSTIIIDCDVEVCKSNIFFPIESYFTGWLKENAQHVSPIATFLQYFSERLWCYAVCYSVSNSLKTLCEFVKTRKLIQILLLRTVKINKSSEVNKVPKRVRV